ncbi:MAG TPA: hypothetical protein VK970_23750 [Candidatus Methylacidiphilales bacterium]|nr:hypothetical protein [Candidatus Methylacidiphilales bacterium]
MDSSNQFIGPYYLQESDEPVMAIECRDGQKFLVTLESRSGETGWIAILVSLKTNGVSGLGSALSMSKIFQVARPTAVTPEEQERIRALVLPVQQAILHDPELEIDIRDLRFGARPLSDWRKSNPDHPSRRRLEKEREDEEWRIRNELNARQEAALLKPEQPEPDTSS